MLMIERLLRLAASVICDVLRGFKYHVTDHLELRCREPWRHFPKGLEGVIGGSPIRH
jgi:hypothetical protein